MAETIETFIIKQMEIAGMRITNQRKSLVALFAEPPQSYTAVEVYNRLEKNHKGLSYSTVYRNLRTLQELGVLHEIRMDEGMKFSFNRAPKHQHQHHFICLTCGSVTPLPYCPIKEIEINLPHYHISHHRFEVFGSCRKCVVSL